MSEPIQSKKPQKLLFRHILRKVFLEDWGLKLVALAITLALWLGVTGLSTPTKARINVPLNLNVSSDAQITNIPQQQVEIEISGDKRKVDQIARGELTAFLDLTDMKPGNWVVSLLPGEVVVAPLPPGVNLVDVVPGRIGVNIESVEEKEFDVQPETTGDVAPGFEVYSSASIPQRIRVRGPTSVIRALEYVQTDRIDISDKKADFTARQVVVSSPNAQAAILNTVVDVIFRIGERRIERTFTAPISGEPGKTATFTIFGPKTALQKTKADEFKVEMYIDGMGELKPQVTLPADLENLSEVKKVKMN